jgi:predicted dehydrogenase
MAQKIKIGIVGTGGMAGHHAQSFQKIPGVVLASCMDVVPGRAAQFAAKWKIPHVASKIEELLDEVDAVSVVTPDRFHSGPSLLALKAGKHLLCEKPLTVTLAEARQVAAAAAKAANRGQIGMVNFSYRRSAAMQKAMQLVAEGRLGKIRHVHSHYLQCWLNTPVWGSWDSPAFVWRLQTSAGSGGVLGDIGCHILDLTTAVVGEASRVNCTTAVFPKLSNGRSYTSWKGKALDANDTAIVEFKLKDGGLGVMHTTRWAAGRTNQLRLEVHGTKGALCFDLDRSYEELDVCLGSDLKKAKWKTLKLKPAANVWERFIRAIKTKTPDQPDLRRGAEIQATLDACQKSAKSHKWEKIPALK